MIGKFKYLKISTTIIVNLLQPASSKHEKSDHEVVCILAVAEMPKQSTGAKNKKHFNSQLTVAERSTWAALFFLLTGIN